MDVTQKGIVTLLKSGVTGKKLPLPEGFDLQGQETLVRKHHMSALIYQGAVQCGVDRKLPVMQVLFQDYCRALLKSEGQMRELARVFAAFDENGIDYLPLKGCKMKALYPKPELRTMGDGDVLIRTEQQNKIRPVMEQLGFTEKGGSDHEWIWYNSSLYLELHKCLVPPSNKDLYSYFGNGWKLARRDSSGFALSPEDTYLFQFTHFTRHFRDGGIGCRHITDLWVYLQNNPRMDEDYIQAALGKLHLRAFHENIRKLLGVWFEDAPEDERSDFITDFLFTSGSWGFTTVKILSNGARDAKDPAQTGRSKAGYLFRVAFPGVGILQDKYTVLKKAPWLLPAVWAYRPVYKLLWERGTLKKHKQNMELLTPENIDRRQQALRYVGLDER